MRYWWEQYEDRADELERKARNFSGTQLSSLLYGAADDLRTLVLGLKEYEQERAAVSPADTTEAG